MHISQVISDYLESLAKERRMAAHTVRAYTGDLAFFSAWCEETGCTEILEIEKLEPRQLRAFWAGRRSSGLSAQSMRRGQSAMRGLFKYAQRRKFISHNPMASMESPRAARPLPGALSQDDINHLLNSPDTTTLSGLRDRAILEILYGSGLRVSEAVSLTQNSIDFSNGIVRITGKGNKDRVVPVTEASSQIILDYINQRNALKPQWKGQQTIFLNPSGKPLTVRSIARIIEKYARQLAMMKNITPHQFRHSFATHLLNNGADIRAVQEMLGHASLSTTQIYTRISKERLLQTYRDTHPRSGE